MMHWKARVVYYESDKELTKQCRKNMQNFRVKSDIAFIYHYAFMGLINYVLKPIAKSG
jgi:hypothetical protein